MFQLGLTDVTYGDNSALFCDAIPGELQSKFTVSVKPYMWSWLCDADIKMH